MRRRSGRGCRGSGWRGRAGSAFYLPLIDPAALTAATEQITLLRAFGFWGASVCGFAALALLAIYWHIGRRTRDVGQAYLAASVACWAMSGGVEVGYASALQEALAAGAPLEPLFGQLAAWRSVLSLSNSLLILLALPYFRYLPPRLTALAQSRYWPLVVGLPFAIALLPTARQLLTGRPSSIVSELDVYYALLTLAFLGLVLWSSFVRRRLPALAYLTAVCTVVTIGAQALKLGADPGTQVVLAAVFKTCLIMLFFALALSWVRELTETAGGRTSSEAETSATPVALELLGSREVRLSGIISSKETTKFQLTPTVYELLHRFAERRTNAPDGGWLEIKPKHEAKPRKLYDIRDHNEVRRLLHALLDGLYGAGHWGREQHELPLKRLLFESDATRPRTLRLALAAEHVTLASTVVSVS